MNTKTVLPIKGMHCRACETLVERSLLKLPGVTQAEASHGRAEVQIEHAPEVSRQEMENAIAEAGYEVGEDKQPWITRKLDIYTDLTVAAVALLILYLLLDGSGILSLTMDTSANYSSLVVVLLVGLAAGFSTCMAVAGGIVLALSSRVRRAGTASSKWRSFLPHVWFNLGRLLSFAFFGGLMGWLGSVLQVSTSIYGVLLVAVGLLMLVMGLQMTGVFPRLSRLGLALPKFFGGLARFADSPGSSAGPAKAGVTGGLTFFLPCSFTQAMQLYAVSTGSPLAGALTMATFALGTSVGLLGVGGLATLARGFLGSLFFRAAGLAVLAMAVFSIQSGYNLTGLTLGMSSVQAREAATPVPASGASLPAPTSGPAGNVAPSGGPSTPQAGGQPTAASPDVQIVNMAQVQNGYRPNAFTIRKGINVRWVIDSQAPYSCATSLVVPRLGIRKQLKAGQNVVEFVANEKGPLKFACSMGMYTGVFNVVD